MPRRFLRSLLPLVVLLLGVLAKVNAYTIEEAVSNALANSPDLLIETNLREEVNKQLREAYAGYLPTLEMTGSWGEEYANNATTRGAAAAIAAQSLPVSARGFIVPSGTTTMQRTEFNLVASQMLFDGLQVYHTVQGQKARVKAESWRVNSTAQDVALSVIEAYLDVLTRRELVGVGKQNLALHEKISAQIQKRSESGIGRKADLDQAKARLALAYTNLMTYQGELHDAETSFTRQVGITVPTDLTQPSAPKPFPKTEAEAVDLGLKLHPTVHAAKEDFNVTKEDHKGAKSAFSPKFNLELTMSRNHNLAGLPGDADSNTAIVRMRWNLFNGGKDLARMCETAYKMQEAQETSNRTSRQVFQAVRFGWNLYETSNRELPYLEMHVTASRNTTDAYQQQFNIGQRTLLDLLDSQNELFSAQSSYIRGKYDRLRGMYRVLNAVGMLTEGLDIQLPKQAIPRPNGVMDGTMRFFEKSYMLFDK